MSESSPDQDLSADEQMLRLVARGFYRELINYGVKEPQILTVASHLLDNVVLKSPPESQASEPYSQLFRIKDVIDRWDKSQTLGIHEVAIAPLTRASIPTILEWLKRPTIRESFYPPFPQSEDELETHLFCSGRDYLAITFKNSFVGIIGGEQVDPHSAKVEMRKMIGSSEERGKGIGKRATFLFLYYAFIVRQFEKVFIHSMDTNIRNLNLNANFGFVLEGVFFDDARVEGTMRDVVRMALSVRTWKEMFGSPVNS
jgi:RimJ/RimL family protein N-acetyltransferase